MEARVSAAPVELPAADRWRPWEPIARAVAVVLRDAGPLSFRDLTCYMADRDSAAIMDGVAWLDLRGWAAFDHDDAKTWYLTIAGRAAVKGEPPAELVRVERGHKGRSGNPRGKKASEETVAFSKAALDWFAANPWSPVGRLWEARVIPTRDKTDFIVGYLKRHGKLIAHWSGLANRNFYAVAGTPPKARPER
jgi:hypothetical protein